MKRCDRKRTGIFTTLSIEEIGSVIQTTGKTPHASYCDVEEHDLLTSRLISRSALVEHI